MSRRDQLFLGDADAFTFDFGSEAVAADNTVGFGDAVDEDAMEEEELQNVVLTSANAVRLSESDVYDLTAKCLGTSIASFMKRPHPDLSLSDAKKKLEDHLVLLTENLKLLHQRAQKRWAKKVQASEAVPTKRSSRMSHRQKWGKKKKATKRAERKASEPGVTTTD